jgi:hypothetical protein
MNGIACQFETMSRRPSFEVLRATMLYLVPHKKVARRLAFGKSPDGTLGMLRWTDTPGSWEKVDVGVSIYTILHPDDGSASVG